MPQTQIFIHWLLPTLNNAKDNKKLQIHKYSQNGQIYAEFITMNSNLGNRAPLLGLGPPKNMQTMQRTRYCSQNGQNHLLVTCEVLRHAREVLGISDI